jgi:hypothetical protein
LKLIISEEKEAPMIASYVGRWSQAQSDQLELCANVEVIAGRLPCRDADAFLSLAVQLTAVMSRVRAFEEDELFPVLEAMSGQVRPLLVTFRSHHHRDKELATEICRALCGASVMDAQELRHLKVLLGSFAEAVRRHVEFEEAIALALFASKRIIDRRAVQ